MEEEKPSFPITRPDDVGPFTFATALASTEADRLERGRYYWISPRTSDLAERAAKSLPKYRLRNTDPPSRSGFMVLSKPLPLPVDTSRSDFSSESVTAPALEIAGISWGTSEALSSIDFPKWGIEGARVLWLSFWGIPEDMREIEKRFAGAPEGLKRKGLESLSVNARITPLVYDRESVIPFSDEWRDWPKGVFDPQVDHIIRMTLTIWNFIRSEKLTDVREVKPDPRSRLTKRKRKKGTPLSGIRVVNIRGTGLTREQPQKSEQGGEQSGREYTVWRPVVPFLRWQYYPSLDDYDLKEVKGHQRRTTNNPDIDTVYKVDHKEEGTEE
ncbi:hypothetical protein [Actinomadura rubrisoli]|uniref:Uncharacterized protein n=1 Tax=Actinomadura rubrisoli TaxID=2530368 RepID=A0A4R5CB65_9ACTN|nr:hypothetical protein [Actinomadura rubrisoli]TDD97191.1 hypothetical protein E1298_01780 [Actinomadura rubrisoli]